MRHRAANNTTLGILGGGQLGMLTAQAAKSRGLRVHLYLEKEEHAPATPFADQVFMGDGFQDKIMLTKFLTACDVVILENEFVPADLLQEISRSLPVRFVPSLASYGVFQNKSFEKLLAYEAGLKVVPWRKINSFKDISDMLSDYPRIVLKTFTGGYDGYGNLVVDAQTSEKAIKQFLARGEVLAEAYLDYQMELAVVVARNHHGSVSFPVAETIQQQQICHYVITPARISDEMTYKIQQSAQAIIEAIDGHGLYGIEFFLTQDNQLYYNETAPRPHNSAHFTITGCDISQFDMLICLALEEKLPEPQLKTPAVGMLNLLGTRHGSPYLEPAESFQAHSEGELCLYGKPWSRPGRKMGHFNLPGESVEAVLSKLEDLKQRYQL